MIPGVQRGSRPLVLRVNGVARGLVPRLDAAEKGLGTLRPGLVEYHKG